MKACLDTSVAYIPFYEFGPSSGTEESEVRVRGDIVWPKFIWISNYEC